MLGVIKTVHAAAPQLRVCFLACLDQRIILFSALHDSGFKLAAPCPTTRAFNHANTFWLCLKLLSLSLPHRWRLRVLGERVTALRAALPSLHAAEAAGLYLGAPTMLCYPSTEVARRLRALASLLRCSYASAVQLVRSRV